MNLAVSLRDSGELLYNMHDRAGSAAKYRGAADIFAGVSVKREPNNVLVRGRYSEMLVMLGGVLAETGHVSEAHEMTGQGLAIAKELASRDDATADELYGYARELPFLFAVRSSASLLLAVDYARKAVAERGRSREVIILTCLPRPTSNPGIHGKR